MDDKEMTWLWNANVQGAALKQGTTSLSHYPIWFKYVLQADSQTMVMEWDDEGPYYNFDFERLKTQQILGWNSWKT